MKSLDPCAGNKVIRRFFFCASAVFSKSIDKLKNYLDFLNRL